MHIHTGAPCPGGTETASSPAFAAPVPLGPDSPGGLATVPANATPGTYPVTATCAGDPVATGSIVIADPAAPAAGGGWGAGAGPADAALVLAGYGALMLTGGAGTAAALRLVRRKLGGAVAGA
ncbi:hypothetical protein OHV05_00630 [Kitasatospora sp. NBC_00070]|uniref:hypothetical protein n=1 Tax=Kitasatospora sp. NBC_00070 TaxID=2975962 RepID=UPI00324F8C4E